MKKMFVKTVAIFFLALSANAVVGRVAYAGGTTTSFYGTPIYGGAPCVPVYGGGEQCPRIGQVLIDKKVKNPATNLYVDNLGPTDPKYRPQQVVSFQIIVKNSGDATLNQVVVNDKIPQFVDYMSGPGNFNKETGVLTFNVDNLTPGSSQIFELKARVVHQSVLPAEKSIVCPVNVVDAKSDSQNDHDESQFCIEKEFVAPEVPKAGPEHWVFSLIGLGSALNLGVFLRRKSY